MCASWRWFSVRRGSRAFIVQQFSLSATAYWCPFCIQPRDIRLVALESADAHLPDHRVRHLLQRRVGAAAPNGSASPDASVILCRPPCKGRPGTDRTTGGPGRLGGDSRRLPRRGETSGSERVIMDAGATSHITRSGNVPKITQPQTQPTGHPRQCAARPNPSTHQKTNNPTQFTQLPS